MIGLSPGIRILMKGEEMASRKDNRGRVLLKGGRYQYAYTNIAGKRCYFYASNLTDLRKKERDLQIATWQGAALYGSTVSLNYMYDRALSLKIGLKSTFGYPCILQLPCKRQGPVREDGTACAPADFYRIQACPSGWRDI